MVGKSFGEEFGEEFTGKAVMWGPAIAGAILLGPVGIALGLAASVAVIASGGDNPPQPSGGDSHKE
jgi:uncharacterized membrane protein